MVEEARIKHITIFILLLLLVNLVTNIECKIIKHPKILIVGAGASGIAAAAKLYENGFTNITILEAENRIGGRLHSVKLGDYNVDLGAQWVHGEEGNVAFQLAYPLDLLDKSNEPELDTDHKYFDSLGNLLNDETNQIFMDFDAKYLHDDEFGNGTFTSFGDYVEKKFDKEFKNVSKIYKGKQKYLRYLEISSILWDSAESWYNLSASKDYQYHECLGNQLINWKNRTYITILDILLKRYPDPKQVIPVLKKTILNSEVKTIDYAKNINNNFNQIKVKTTKGKVYKADHVIVTTSLGILKAKHGSMFKPALPNYKVEAIKYLGYGAVGKVFVLFDKPFWNIENKKIVYFSFLWNDAERKSIKKGSEKEWLFGMSGASSVEYKPNLLECWVSGKYVRMMERLSTSKVFNHTIENLDRFFGKTFKITKPLKILRTQWYSNPHFRGTYSYRSVHADKNNVTAALLEKPLNEEYLSILFAGEATSTDRFSTVDGAISTGWKAADRLINHYKKV